jgi:hypothetical protein
MQPAEKDQSRGENFEGWPLRDRLELLAFDARLAGVPPALLEALWEATDALPSTTHASTGTEA